MRGELGSLACTQKAGAAMCVCNPGAGMPETGSYFNNHLGISAFRWQLYLKNKELKKPFSVGLWPLHMLTSVRTPAHRNEHKCANTLQHPSPVHTQ